MKNIKINPLFFFVLLISIFLKVWDMFFLAFLTATLHEVGHLIMIKGSRVEIKYIKIEPFGISIKLKNLFIKNPQDEIKIAIAGPLCNFIVSLLCLVLLKEKAHFLYFSNLCMGLFNLLPALPLDGGRILKAHLSKKMGYLRSYKLTLFITRIISVITVATGFFILYVTKFNFSVCIIGFFLIFNLFSEKNHTYFFMLKEITSYKEKNREIEKMPVNHVAVNKNFYIRKIFYDLSLWGYHIFSVVENGKVLRTFSEGELMEGLIKYGSSAKVEDLL